MFTWSPQISLQDSVVAAGVCCGLFCDKVASARVELLLRSDFHRACARWLGVHGREGALGE